MSLVISEFAREQRSLYCAAVINYSRPVIKKSLADIAYPKIFMKCRDNAAGND